MAERLSGARVNRLGRRAKYLAADLDTGETLIMHLGMSGRFTLGGEGLASFVHGAGGDPRHDHVLLEIEGGTTVTFNDPRRFGFFQLWPSAGVDTYPAFAALGPEPLANDFSGAALAEAFQGRRTPVKTALLDQRVVAGLGNIYVCEALHRAGISPRRQAASIGTARSERLAEAVRAVIREAIEAGGSSISDFAAADGGLGYFQHRFEVYGREGEACRGCGGAIRRIVQSGRSSFYCGTCQR